MDIAHFTLVNLKILTIEERKFDLYYDTESIYYGSQCQKSVVVISILQVICLGHVLETPGSYQQILL